MTKRKKIKLTAEQIAALCLVRVKYGRTWKVQLSLLWASGADVNALPDDRGCYLRQVRNLIGPSGLVKLDLDEEISS